jgi:methylenetetrahydrofolate dehydrogenase (NADP+) / methenyltetrahydrofolate cyclohydrolase
MIFTVFFNNFGKTKSHMTHSPTILAAKPVADAIRSHVAERVQKFKTRHNRAPKLTVVLVGENPASVVYTNSKGKAAVAAGMEHETIRFPETATSQEVCAAVRKLNEDPNVDGILIQRPLPKSFKEEEVLYWVAPEKDVDAFHPENVGKLSLGLPCFRPCTPSGVMEILKFYKIALSGKIACVIGRSAIVGKPMSMMLLQENVTVLQTHSKTPDLRVMCKQADIVVAAIGRGEMIDSSYLKQGAVVIDVGMNRNAEGKLVGDVNFDDVSKIASAITPVPGGVGPMTITILLQNTVWAAEMSEGR